MLGGRWPPQPHIFYPLAQASRAMIARGLISVARAGRLAAPSCRIPCARVQAGGPAGFKTASAAASRVWALQRSSFSSLRTVLDQEIEVEDDAEDLEGEGIQSLLKSIKKRGFQLVDEPGKAEVRLVGKGVSPSEKVTITFNILDDITGEDDDEYWNDEEEDEGEGESAKPSTPADSEVDDEDDDDEAMDEPAFEFTASIKKGGEELVFDCEARSEVTIRRVLLVPSGGSVDDYSSYMGPVFDELEPDMQTAFHDYLEARGINDDLSSFICMYSDAKEQKEFVSWMKGVRNFLDK